MLLHILVNITLPVFLLIGAGILAERAYKVDVDSLVKLNFNVFLPALVFLKALDASLPPELFGGVAVFNLLHTALILGVSWALFSLPGLRGNRPELTLASLLPNAGNYGIPLAMLAFGAAGANIMAIIVLIQIFITITLGLWIIDSGRTHWRDALVSLLKTPILWASLAAVLMMVFKLQLPTPIRQPVEYLADGLIPLALVTLGAQLSRSRSGKQIRPLALVTLMRLLVAPLLAWFMLLGWEAAARAGMLPSLGLAGPVLIIAAGMPVAVNAYILSSEYNRDGDLVSQTVLWSTLISALSLTIWLAVL